MESTERLVDILPAAVREAQEALARRPLWRVWFLADGNEVQAEDEYFVVYPDVVRIHQLSAGRTLDEAVAENARLRLANLRERERHRDRRRADLKAAVVAAFDKLRESEDAAVLVAWYDTRCHPGFDPATGGEPGTSAWVLLREPLSEKSEIAEPDGNLYVYESLATPDGVLNGAETPETRRLLHFDSSSVRSELTFTLRGKLYKFVKNP